MGSASFLVGFSSNKGDSLTSNTHHSTVTILVFSYLHSFTIVCHSAHRLFWQRGKLSLLLHTAPSLSALLWGTAMALCTFQPPLPVLCQGPLHYFGTQRRETPFHPALSIYTSKGCLAYFSSHLHCHCKLSLFYLLQKPLQWTRWLPISAGVFMAHYVCRSPFNGTRMAIFNGPRFLFLSG